VSFNIIELAITVVPCPQEYAGNSTGDVSRNGSNSGQRNELFCAVWSLLVHNYNLRIFAKFVEVSGYSTSCCVTLCKWSTDSVISVDSRLEAGWSVV
jgi:hypothetical protein